MLTLAQEESHRRRQNYIGSEHLLLGLVREGKGMAAQALRELGVTTETARSAFDMVVIRPDQAPMGLIGLTPRAKRTIELSVEEARRRNHHYISTEHILLGLLNESDLIAVAILERLGVSPQAVRAALERRLGQPPQDSG